MRNGGTATVLRSLDWAARSGSAASAIRIRSVGQRSIFLFLCSLPCSATPLPESVRRSISAASPAPSPAHSAAPPRPPRPVRAVPQPSPAASFVPGVVPRRPPATAAQSQTNSSPPLARTIPLPAPPLPHTPTNVRAYLLVPPFPISYPYTYAIQAPERSAPLRRVLLHRSSSSVPVSRDPAERVRARTHRIPSKSLNRNVASSSQPARWVYGVPAGQTVQKADVPLRRVPTPTLCTHRRLPLLLTAPVRPRQFPWPSNISGPLTSTRVDRNSRPADATISHPPIAGPYSSLALAATRPAPSAFFPLICPSRRLHPPRPTPRVLCPPRPSVPSARKSCYREPCASGLPACLISNRVTLPPQISKHAPARVALRVSRLATRVLPSTPLHAAQHAATFHGGRRVHARLTTDPGEERGELSLTRRQDACAPYGASERVSLALQPSSGVRPLASVPAVIQRYESTSFASFLVPIRRFSQDGLQVAGVAGSGSIRGAEAFCEGTGSSRQQLVSRMG
ncbi:hypothetical protein C8Q70DRAFT_403470 [Cubamyces menziesii]|nr:hypothetical protein C8Q70DRAFT_403470 [Cubamyces menziesii]